MFIVNHRKIFFILSIFLIIGSFAAIYAYGLNFGIDFTGGSILELSYPNGRPTIETIKTNIDSLNIGQYAVAPTGESNITIKTHELSPAEKTRIESVLSTDPSNIPTEVRFNSIGPSVGSELKNKAFVAIGIVILCIVLFITFAFRHVSRPVSSWKYGIATIIALVHDVVIPTGVFVVWTHFRGGEIDLLFVTALLAILGYSVHDTIVVFDRVRENLSLPATEKESFIQTVGKSVNQTFGRSINTSLTIFLVLVALYFVGGHTTKDFTFVLLVGIIAGTYSSIFIASPLLVTMVGKVKKS